MKAHIVPELGDTPVSELDAASLLGFVDTLKARKKSPATIRNVLSVLRSFLDVVRVRKLAPILVNPTRDADFVRQGVPRRQRGPKPQLSLEVAEKLLMHPELPERWRVRILIGCTRWAPRRRDRRTAVAGRRSRRGHPGDADPQGGRAPVRE
jgi:hypothetical protein